MLNAVCSIFCVLYGTGMCIVNFFNRVVITGLCCVLNHVSYVVHSKQIHLNSPAATVSVINVFYNTNIVPEEKMS